MSEPMIEVRNLNRTFGDVRAVADASFSIAAGKVAGFIGANGAGKTTTMRMMATLETPDSGTISIGGCDVVNYPTRVRRKIGWMPDTYGTYPNTTVLDYLDFYARAFGFKHAERASRIEEVMEFTDLKSLADRPIDKLSKGMAQRLCLGRTLLHDPEVLILDEPAAGLDPKARLELKHLIRLLAQDGKTIFISSHILSELGEMCDTLLFIDAGRILHHGTTESLQRHDETHAVVVDVRVAGDPALLETWALTNPGVQWLEATKHGGRLQLNVTGPDDVAACLRRMIQADVPVIDFHRQERRLEDAFVEMLKKVQPN